MRSLSQSTGGGLAWHASPVMSSKKWRDATVAVCTLKRDHLLLMGLLQSGAIICGWFHAMCLARYIFASPFDCVSAFTWLTISLKVGGGWAGCRAAPHNLAMGSLTKFTVRATRTAAGVEGDDHHVGILM